MGYSLYLRIAITQTGVKWIEEVSGSRLKVSGNTLKRELRQEKPS
jgi:hypothetical protein